jgi:hypothetical protein
LICCSYSKAFFSHRSAQIVDYAVPEDKVLSSSLEMAAKISTKNRHIFGELKKQMFHKVSGKLKDSLGLERMTVLPKL